MNQKTQEVASYCDHAFEAAQRAFALGETEQFRTLSRQHCGLVELFHHLTAGGSIH